jgi:malate permease and related proteins
MQIIETISATLPVILLVFTGIILRRIKLITRSTIDDFQRLVVNITLPLLLFKAFATMHFESRYFLLVAVIFTACTIVLFISSKLSFIPGLKNPYASFLMAGFEAGMLGYAMFSAIYGVDNISYFAVIDLGQVLFVFFILITRLEVFQGRDIGLARTLMNFFKTPVILGILAGGLVNAMGIYKVLETQALTGSILRTAEILAGMTTPLVAIVIGYGLKFRTKGISEPVKTVSLRLILWVVLALAFNYLIIRQLLGLDRMFEAAVLIMAILPAPFVVPFYLPSENDDSKEYILNALSLGTVVALFASVIVRLMYNA